MRGGSFVSWPTTTIAADDRLSRLISMLDRARNVNTTRMDGEWSIVTVRLNEDHDGCTMLYAIHSFCGWAPPLVGEKHICSTCDAEVPEHIVKKIRAYNFLTRFTV